jgi:hypothetical protein
MAPVASRESVASVATLNVAELPPASAVQAAPPATDVGPALAGAASAGDPKAVDANATASADTNVRTNANTSENASADAKPRTSAETKPMVRSQASALLDADPKRPEPPAEGSSVHRDEARHANALLSRASARSGAQGEDTRAHLAEARLAARDHATDARALRGWATAAMQAGETREARRAAEAWAIYDGSAEPRLFLAGALEAGGRRREARAVLEEWLVNHPDSAEAKRMLARLGSSPEPAIKRHSHGRAGHLQLHPPDPIRTDE